MDYIHLYIFVYITFNKRSESIEYLLNIVLSLKVRYLHTNLFIYNSKSRSQRMSLMYKVLTSSFPNVLMFSYFFGDIWDNSCIINY